MINETISIDAGPAIGELDALASAAEEAAAKIDASFKSIKTPSLGGSGAGNMARSLDAAAAKVEAAVAKIEASFARLGGVGAGAADSLAAVGRVASESAAGVTRLADAEKAAADAGARVSKSSTTAADGIKGLGDSTKKSSAWLDEYNATMAESAKMQRDFAKVSADTSAKVAVSQRLQTAAARDASADAVRAQKAQRATAEESAAAAEASSHRWKMAGLAGLAVVAYGVDQAAKLQAGVTRLQTTAGESAKNLPMISAGILKLAPETATSQAQLLQGAYMAESAGFHGQNALNVLKAGAQGAYAEGAPLGDTINALTSVMNAYGMRGSKAPVSAMDQIIAMVSRGKMTMAGAVAALPTVLPTAASAGLDFGQVGGALSTMTATGTSPDLAAQHLNYTIGHLQNMSGVQTGEIQQLGGDPVKLENQLGKKGLLGTLGEINSMVTGSMGKSGLVLMSTFNKSASAAADANRMMNALPPSVRGVAKAYLDGSIGVKAFNKEVRQGPESARDANLLKQFQSTAGAALGFGNLLKSGSPAAQTYEAALSKALGGGVGLQTFLQLEGIHAPVAAANTAAVTQAGKKPGADVTGWPEVQKTLKFQLGSAEQGLQSVATELGKAFLPLATTGFKGLGDIAKFFAGHETLTKDLGILGGGLLGAKLAKQFSTSLASQVGSIGKALKIPGMDKLANLGKGTGLDTAAAGLGEAGAGLKGAAAALAGAAEKLGGPGMPGGKPREEPGAPGTPGRPGREGAPEPRRGRPARDNVTTGLGGALAALTMVDPILANWSSGPHGKNWLDNPFGMPGPNDPKSRNNWLTSFSPYERLFQTGKAGPAPSTVPAGMAPAVYSRFGASAGSAPAPAIKPKVQAPDTSAVTAAAGHVKSILDGALSSVSGKKPKIQAPDMSALDSAKGKAQSAGNAITQAITGALGKPVHAKSPDLSAYSSAAGKARADGANISAGLAAGILAGEGAVVAAAGQVAAAAAAAMAHAVQSHSPSKKTEKTGKDMTAGLVIGLQGGQSAVDAAATALGRNAAKATDIAAIDNTAKKLLSEVPRGGTALTRMLKADTRDLERMANTRAKLEAEIANSEQVAKSVIGNASITSALNAVNPAGNEPIASSAVVTGQGYQASTLKQFAASLKQLQGMGLNATALSQLAQGDPSQELPVAQGIASGGKQAVRQLNQLQKQMQSSAAAIGNIAGPAMYQAGKDVGQGLAAGLKSELGSLDKAMEHLAKSMVASVQHHTKTAKKAAHKTAAGTTADAAAAAAGSLPASGAAASRAAARTGKDSLSVAAASLSQAGASLSGAATALNSAAAALNKAAAGGGPGGTPHAPVTHPGARAGARPLSGPSGGGYGGGGAGPAGYQPSFGIGSGGTHYHQHVNVTVHGSVMAQNDLMDTVQSGLVTRGINNWQTGIIPPGRAG